MSSLIRTLLLTVPALFALTAGAGAGEDVTVVIMRDMAFQPEKVTVRVGDTVRWENHERRQFHNVWFRELDEEPSPYLFPEEHLERAFDRPGTFPYVCQPHEGRGMIGVVKVVE